MPSHFYDSLVVEEGLDEAGVLQGDQQEQYTAKRKANYYIGQGAVGCIDEFLIVSDLISTRIDEFVRGLDRLLAQQCQSRAGEDFEEHCDVAPGSEIGPVQGPCGGGLILSPERIPVLFE